MEGSYNPVEEMPKAESSKRSLVSIFNKKGDHAGFGVYIGSDLILTCAHVLQEKENGSISQEVQVQFAALDVPPLQAKVMTAKPPVLENDTWKSGDAALLKLTTPAPVEAQAAPLVILASLPENWLVLGFPQINPKLTEINGDFKLSHPLPELRGAKDENITIEAGFSGSPVFDKDADQVLGLVRSGMSRWDKHGDPMPVRQSYMLPIAMILEQLPSPELKDRISNKYIRLSTVAERKSDNAKLIKAIQQEAQKRGIESTFDCRISTANRLDEIRKIHSQPVIESYPKEQKSGSYWRADDFLDDLRRESSHLDSAIFHLQAPGGAGKSVIARDIVQQALTFGIVPYFIDINLSQNAVTNSGEKSEYKIEDLFRGTIAGGAKLLQDDLEAERLCLLVADGLNESASHAPKWLALLRQLSEDHPNLRVLVCDRIVDRSADIPNAQLLTVHPLSKQAINDAMKAAGRQAITDAKLLDLLSTPFFLHLALPRQNAGQRPAGIQGSTRTEVFAEYFRMALKIHADPSNPSSQQLAAALQKLSTAAYDAYTQENHLVLHASTVEKLPAEFRTKLEQAGALLEVRQDQIIGYSFRHQLLHDYLAGYYLATHLPPDYERLHGATWRGENPEPVHFALEIIGKAGSDDFLNHVYDWNYSVTIGCLRDAEKSQQSTVSDCFKGAVAALIALKIADGFVETRQAGQRDLKIFETGLARSWREAVMAAELSDPEKIENLLTAVKEKFLVEGCPEASVVNYGQWKETFLRTAKPGSGDEQALFVDNPLMGWTAANSFRRTGAEPWFYDRLKGAYFALRESGVSAAGEHNPVARVARRRIVYILGTAQDDDTVTLLEKVIQDSSEDDDVKNDSLRSLLEIASKNPGKRQRIVESISGTMSKMAADLRRRILKSHRVVNEDVDWRTRMLDLIKEGEEKESDPRYKEAWKSAKNELTKSLTVPPPGS